MIFVFSDDNSINVLDNIDDVRRECEGIDVEDGVYRFFNEKGYPLEVVFIKPNIKRKLIGSMGSVVSGVFELTSSITGDNKEILKALEDTVALQPNKHFKSIEEIKEFITI